MFYTEDEIWKKKLVMIIARFAQNDKEILHRIINCERMVKHKNLRNRLEIDAVILISRVKCLIFSISSINCPF